MKHAMTKKRWQVGLLGAGYICEAHATALQGIADVEIAAVCDRARDKAVAAAKKFGISTVCTTLDEMLAGTVNVVHVLLPPHLHFEASRQILESGRHVFLEKPMALRAAECRVLADLAVAKNLRLAVNHNFLFLPAYEKLRQQAGDGTLGKLDHITVNWLYPLGQIQSGPFDNWMLREPGNLFLELGPHLVAFAMDLVGPLDQLRTTVSRPIDLPGGYRVYRYWHVHGMKGNTAIDLTLSVIPGYGERSVTVHAYAATAKCDYARNLYYRDEPSGYGLVTDNFVTTVTMACQLAANGIGNFLKAVINTLRKTPAANPYGECIERSIRAFYRAEGSQPDARLSGQFGVAVITACEQIVQQASFARAENTAEIWSVKPPLRSPTVLVIGGTGFIGKYLVKALVACGYGVRVTTRGMDAGQIALAGLPLELVQGDLADPAFIDSALAGIDVVYHLAKADGKKWEDYYTQDVVVTRNIADRARVHGIKRFIYTGTIDSYYSANAQEVITSDTKIDPMITSRNHYARSKAACEALLLDLYRQQGFPVVIFRPGIVIGKGCPPAHWGVGMFQSATRVQFWGSGRNKLPLVLVEDVAQALVLGLDKAGIEGQSFLLTDAPLLSARDYVDVVLRETGTRLRASPTPIWMFFLADALKELAKHAIKHPNRRVPSYRDWDSRSHRARYDNSATRQVLGWQPAGTREALIERGIVAAVRDFMR